MSKIAIIVGTRPEAIKLIPVYKAFQKINTVEAELISTGQHKEMLSQVFDIFNVKPDVSLNLMTHGQTLNGLSSKLIESLDKLITERQYAAVVVQGDTTTAMTGAMTAFNIKTRVYHVEAGLRSHNLAHPFPEEANRKVIAVYANINFTPTKIATTELLKENVPKEKISQVGNTVIDALLNVTEIIKTNKSKYDGLFTSVIENKPFVLVTAHRRENFGESFRNICNAIIKLAQDYKNHQFIYPVHLNPSVKNTVHDMMGNIDNIKLIPPQQYDNMVYLIQNCQLILTDSGGIQEEAPTFSKPVLVMRKTTERTEGIEEGCAILVGTETNNIIEKVKLLLDNKSVYDKMSSKSNPYGDGNSSTRIAKKIEADLVTN